MRRQVHPGLLKARRTELFEENYFHSILEATKSVAEKVRELSGLALDGADLVNEAFGTQGRDCRERDLLLALNSPSNDLGAE